MNDREDWPRPTSANVHPIAEQRTGEKPKPRKARSNGTDRPVIPLPKDETVTDDRGRLVPNVANVLTVLRNVSDVERCFAYNEMRCATMLVAPLPMPSGKIANDSGERGVREVRDTDVTQLQESACPRSGATKSFRPSTLGRWSAPTTLFAIT
jgi:hypothetical protein